MSTYLSDYDYFLPEELIGQKPREPRDSAKLMLIDRKNGSVEHKNFYNIIDYLQKGEYIKSDIKIKNISEAGRNLTRKFEGILARNKKIELYSDNDIKKNYTLIVEKLN